MPKLQAGQAYLILIQESHRGEWNYSWIHNHLYQLDEYNRQAIEKNFKEARERGRLMAESQVQDILGEAEVDITKIRECLEEGLRIAQYLGLLKLYPPPDVRGLEKNYEQSRNTATNIFSEYMKTLRELSFSRRQVGEAIDTLRELAGK